MLADVLAEIGRVKGVLRRLGAAPASSWARRGHATMIASPFLRTVPLRRALLPHSLKEDQSIWPLDQVVS